MTDPDEEDTDFPQLALMARQLAEQRDAMHIRQAAQLGVILHPLPWDEYHGDCLLYRSTVAGRKDIHLAKLGDGWRIQECGYPGTYDRHWRYQFSYGRSFTDAVRELGRWDCDPLTEPHAWTQAWDGRSAHTGTNVMEILSLPPLRPGGN